MELNRRDFLRGAALTAGAVAVASALPLLPPPPPPEAIRADGFAEPLRDKGPSTWLDRLAVMADEKGWLFDVRWDVNCLAWATYFRTRVPTLGDTRMDREVWVLEHELAFVHVFTDEFVQGANVEMAHYFIDTVDHEFVHRIEKDGLDVAAWRKTLPLQKKYNSKRGDTINIPRAYKGTVRDYA